MRGAAAAYAPVRVEYEEIRHGCEVMPIHIRPRGADRVLCGTRPDIERATAPQFVTGRMGATCAECRLLTCVALRIKMCS